MQMCYLLVAFVLAAVLCPTYTFADYRYKMRSPNHPPPYHLSKPMPPPPSIHHRIFKHKPIRPPLGLRGPPPSLPHPHPLGPPTFHLGKVPVPPPTFHRTAAPPQLKSPAIIAPLWKSPATTTFHHIGNEFHPSISDFHQPLKSGGLFPGGIEDDKGPIHTIPAPNLNPLDKPTVGKSQLLNIPHTTPLFVKANENELSSFSFGHQNQHELTAFTKIPTFASLQTTQQQHLNSLHLNKQSNGYKVHEDSNDEVNPGPDGNPQYYAPDPDPSLPAPKTPLTFDPHSLPSNGKPLPPDLESPHQPPLTSQELYHLLHLYPQKTTPDLHTLQTVKLGGLQDHHSSFSLVEPHENIHPQFHTFNYVEQYDSTKQPSAPGFAQPDFHEYNIVARDNSASEVSKLSVRHTSASEDVVGSEDSSANHYFTALPNKEVADAFAALQAAGNIQTNLISKQVGNDANPQTAANGESESMQSFQYHREVTPQSYHTEMDNPRQENREENQDEGKDSDKMMEQQEDRNKEAEGENMEEEEEEQEEEEEGETISPSRKFIEDLQRRQKENRQRLMVETAQRREQMLQEQRQQQMQRYRHSLAQRTTQQEQREQEEEEENEGGEYADGEEEMEQENGQMGAEDEMTDEEGNAEPEADAAMGTPFRGSVKFGSRLTKRNRQV